MIEYVIQGIAALLILSGAGFSFVAALGLVRLQDVYTRMHASSKAGTLGGGLMLLAVAVFFREEDIITRAIVAIIFIVLTAPVASHMIGRAAYIARVPQWDKSVVDELKGQYDPKSHDLAAAPEAREYTEKTGEKTGEKAGKDAPKPS